MAPLAPIIVSLLPTTGDPVPAATMVAQILDNLGETDPGPFTYAKTQDPGGAFAAITAGDNHLYSAIVLDGAFFVAVTSTSAGGTSPEGSATLVFADDTNEWNDTQDPYEGNAQLPPPIPPNDKWKFFLRQAVRVIVPRSRFGVDYMIARETGKQSGQVVLAWDTALLGPYPSAEVEAYAQELSNAWPWSEPPPP